MPAVFPPLQDARDEVGGAVVAQRLGEHAADVFLVGRHRRAALGLLVERVDHFLDLVARHGLQLGHGGAQLLHLARAEMLEHFRRLVLAEREQQHGAPGDAVVASHGMSLLHLAGVVV